MGHVGDSRAYLLRDDRLEQLTDDHSLVAELVRRGELSPQAAEVHPQRSVITRALGTDPDVDVDAFSVDAQAGDVFLICSDGLSDMVDGEQIEAIVLTHHRRPRLRGQALVQAANRAGGEDNITAVLFELVEGEQAPGEPDERTREMAVATDEEDTLHPGGRRTPAAGGRPSARAGRHDGRGSRRQSKRRWPPRRARSHRRQASAGAFWHSP